MEKYSEDIKCELKRTLLELYHSFHNGVGLSHELDIKLKNSLRYIYQITEALPEKYSRQFNFTFNQLAKLLKDSKISIIEALDIIFKVANILVDTYESHKLKKRSSETAKAMYYLFKILDSNPLLDQDRNNSLENFKNMRNISIFIHNKEANETARHCYNILKSIYNKYYPYDQRELKNIPRWRIPNIIRALQKTKNPTDDTLDFSPTPDELLSTLDAENLNFPDPEIDAFGEFVES